MTPEEYIAAGFRIVPVGPDKRPKLSGFGADNPTFSATPADFSVGDSVGVLCGPHLGAGPPDRWLVCLDFDGDVPEAMLPDSATTLVTHKGRHAWYWVRSDCGLRQWGDALKTKETEGWAVDVRFAGGYAREVSRFVPEEIQDMPAEWLDRILAVRRPEPKPSADAPRSELHTLDERLATWLIEVLDAQWPKAGNGRHDCALALGGTLRGLQVPRGEAEAIAIAIHTVNSDDPGARIRDTIDAWDAADEGRPAKGAAELCRLTNDRGALQNVLDRVAMTRPLVWDESARTEPQAKEASANENPWLKAAVDADWITDPDISIDWVIDKLVATGEPTLLVAAAGAGKTTATIAMALHVAAGKTLWGRFGVPRPGRVVHIDYEQQKSLRRSYQEIAKGAGLDLRQLWHNVTLIPAMPPAGLVEIRRGAVDTEARAATIAHLVEVCTGARLCIVNSLVAATPGVDENSKDVSDALTLLGEVGNRTGCAMLMIHHAGRNTDGHARGHSSIDGVVQTEIRIEKPEDEGHYTDWRQTKDRLGAGRVKPFRLEWKRDGDAGVQTLDAVDLPNKAANGRSPEYTANRIREAIVAHLSEKAATITELKLSITGDDKQIAATAKELTQQGVLIVANKLYQLKNPSVGGFHRDSTDSPTGRKAQ